MHQPYRWEMEADVVVLGYGGAGAVVAITASDLGAGVLILEKQSRDRHTPNTMMAGGGWWCPPNIADAITYMKAFSYGYMDTEIMETYARYLVDNTQWIQEMGGKISPPVLHPEFPELPGHESALVYHLKEGGGKGLFKLLSENVNRRKIEVMYDCPGKELVMNYEGEIIGIVAEKQGRRFNVKARRAVVLATGGFEYDEWMKLNYLRAFPIYFYGNPGNTGDGIKMAQKVGADLWHMNCCAARIVAKFPDFPIAFSMSLSGPDTANAGFIVVDRHGRRFSNEKYKPHTFFYELTNFDTWLMKYPKIPCYWIFDEARRLAGQLPTKLAGPSGPIGLYKWSSDNSVEINKGWVKKANSIKELAVEIGLHPSALEETVDKYNRYCKEGVDPEFGRPPKTLIPLNRPPYYGVKMWPGGPNTQGGPRRNSKAQVLRIDGRPIPRLYEAGELGSIYGMIYQSAGNIAECIAFGRIAGKNAAEERSWA